MAGALSLPDHAIVWLELAVAIPLLILIILAVPTGRRFVVLPVMSVGVLLGWAGWLVLGPYILP